MIARAWELFVVERMRRLTSIVSHLVTEICDIEQGLYPLIIHLENENNNTHLSGMEVIAKDSVIHTEKVIF